MTIRQVIRIDEELCNGCGDCVPSCAEGAIQVIDGKARLVSEVYCDGLGACLGECPLGALSIEEREADEFDEKAVEKHLSGKRAAPEPDKAPATALHVAPHSHEGHACPGSALRSFDRPAAPRSKTATHGIDEPSRLRNWPVQISLLPVKAPFFQGADLLVAADCVPFALNGFHERMLDGKTLMIGCPKLDNAELYARKLTDILRQNDVRSISVAFMEVPCCMGLVHMVEQAIAASGKRIPMTVTRVGVRGEVQLTAGRNAAGELMEVSP